MSREDSNLRELLSSFLPKDVQFEVLNLQSFPRRAPNIIRSSKHITIKTLHFITISHNNVILCGVEVYVYLIINKENEFNNEDGIRKIIYISKVDSTGLFAGEIKLKLTAIIRQILKYIISIKANNYLNFFVDSSASESKNKGISTSKRIRNLLDIIDSNMNDDDNKVNIYSLANNKFLFRKKITTEVLLFTRAEGQYLFPGSYNNKGKHVLSDRELLSWWVNLLNKLIIDNTVFLEVIHCKLTIPGEDKGTILRFINKLSSGVWSLGGIYDKELQSNNSLAVDSIPLFPDDPKGRFLEHLVVEGRIKKMKTRQFWKELAIRQEFRLANVVGIINIKGIGKNNEVYEPAINFDWEKYGIKSINGIQVLNINIDQFKELNIKLNNFDDKDTIVLTNKRLKFLKGFIIGEDYSSASTALNAYANVNYLLNSNFNYLYKMKKSINNVDGYNGFQTVIGKLDYNTLKKATEASKIVPKPIQVLAVKKNGTKKRRIVLNPN